MLDAEATTILVEIDRLEAEVLADTRPARKAARLPRTSRISSGSDRHTGAPWSHFTPGGAHRRPPPMMRLIRRLHRLEEDGLVVCYRPASNRVRRVKLTEAGRLATAK